MKKTKINPKTVMLSIITVLILIIVFQNRAAVETKILFFTFQMPRIFMLLFTFLLGVAAGIVFMLRAERKKGKEKESADRTQ